MGPAKLPEAMVWRSLRGVTPQLKRWMVEVLAWCLPRGRTPRRRHPLWLAAWFIFLLANFLLPRLAVCCSTEIVGGSGVSSVGVTVPESAVRGSSY